MKTAAWISPVDSSLLEAFREKHLRSLVVWFSLQTVP